MKKKLLAVLLTVAMTATLLAGCGSSKSSSGSSEGSGKKEKITVMVPDYGAPSEKLLKQFEKKYNIDVTVNKVKWENIRDKVAIAATGKKATADVIEVDWSWVGEFTKAGWLEPLNISAADKKDMPSIDTFTVNNKVMAVPYFNDFRVSFYNRNQFKKAGITSAPTTWNEVLKDARTIKKSGVNSSPVSIPLGTEENTTTSLIWLAWTMNGVVFNDDGTLNEASIKSALQYEKTLVDEGLVNPTNKDQGGEAYDLINSGQASFMTGPSSHVTSVNDKKSSKVVGQVGAIMVPGKNGVAKQTLACPEGIGVTKFSKHKDAAEKYVKWMMSKKVQDQLNKDQSITPTRNSVLESNIKDGTIKNADVLIKESKLIKSPFPNGVPSYYTEMSHTIYNAVHKMAVGDYTVDQAFNIMNKKVNSLIKENK